MSIILAIVVLGLVVWLVNTFLPIDARFKQLVTVVAVILAVIWIIYAFAGGGDPWRFPSWRRP